MHEPTPNTIDWRSKARAMKADGRCWVAGARAEPSDGGVVESINPATGEVVAVIPDCTPGEIDHAVASARQAFESGDWSGMATRARAEILCDFAEKIAAAAQELALLDSIEMGMPIAEALADVAYSAQMVRTTASMAGLATSAAGMTAPGALQFNLLEPHGVVAAITPWNFPLNQSLVKLAPALAMGNCVVLKPSELASLSSLRLGELAAEAGLPPGVLNVVTGRGVSAGAALAGHADIDHLTFTGSTRTGALIQANGATVSGRPKSMAMELGGKSPQIVCESFDDIEGLAPILARGIFWNAGQVCSAGSHILVHRRHAAALIDAVIAAAAAFQPGDPLDPATTMGPLASAGQFNAVVAHLERADRDGARCAYGGLASATPNGAFVHPTIYVDVHPASALAREEVFGPVLAISTFERREEAAAIARTSGYGLVATVWTRDLNEGHYFSRALRAGAVTINGHAAPLGDESQALGIEAFGRSGFGADYGFAGLRQYARLKLVTFNSH